MPALYRTILVIGDDHAELVKKYSKSAGSEDAHYQYERCPQEDFLAGEDIGFSNPFVLTDGNESYIAKKGEINWERMHGYNTNTYKRVWEMVIDGDEPKNDDEADLFEMMQYRTAYFLDNFANKEEYVNHSTCFWCYGLVDEEKYEECGEDKNKWVCEFFEKFIAPLPDDTLLSIYEVRTL